MVMAFDQVHLSENFIPIPGAIQLREDHQRRRLRRIRHASLRNSDRANLPVSVASPSQVTSKHLAL